MFLSIKTSACRRPAYLSFIQMLNNSIVAWHNDLWPNAQVPEPLQHWGKGKKRGVLRDASFMPFVNQPLSIPILDGAPSLAMRGRFVMRAMQVDPTCPQSAALPSPQYLADGDIAFGVCAAATACS
jgi:hypothetical protein